ncbi:hypothetical protein AZE42_12237 [Rhizopogon vesiculosus]|uniref:Uncharacterized protein n=1 Tax=Rhizopogon vesiculosus TaxID=180088 RepID=A0A1J8PUJ4_9AGAM|nr:hypothetical protein AZE42_12237 [Rhizopogon vesiculosus]
MTDTTEAQHATQDSHGDSAPNNLSMPPIVKPIDSASHDLSKYKISCHVHSVYYHQKPLGGCDNMYAAVVLELCFDQADADIRYVFFPTHALDVSDLNGRPDYERIQMSTKEPLILQRFRIVDENGADVWWHFRNHGDNYFPPSVKLLLVALKLGTSQPFQFTLQIPPTLNVRVKPRSWWHVWSTLLQAKKEKGQRGWSCNIEVDYCPDIAKNILLEYEKPQEEKDILRMVGVVQQWPHIFPTANRPQCPIACQKQLETQSAIYKYHECMSL